MPNTEAMAERARIVAWLRADLHGQGLRNYWAGRLANDIHAGDHDYIAIPRLSGDQGAK